MIYKNNFKLQLYNTLCNIIYAYKLKVSNGDDSGCRISGHININNNYYYCDITTFAKCDSRRLLCANVIVY